MPVIGVPKTIDVITSYSIHYTKLYDALVATGIEPQRRRQVVNIVNQGGSKLGEADKAPILGKSVNTFGLQVELDKIGIAQYVFFTAKNRGGESQAFVR